MLKEKFYCVCVSTSHWSAPFLFCLMKVLDKCIEAENIIDRYEALASDLLDWIEKTIAVISNQKFANSLTGVQQQLQAFTTYCTIEKPVKWVLGFFFF